MVGSRRKSKIITGRHLTAEQCDEGLCHRREFRRNNAIGIQPKGLDLTDRQLGIRHIPWSGICLIRAVDQPLDQPRIETLYGKPSHDGAQYKGRARPLS